MSEKYGFVYIWRDRKHSRYYIGCHWGTEDDGYICSSRWMRNAYKRRKGDFKRKILSRVNDRKELLAEEHKWLSMIKPHELKIKYYNAQNNLFNHWSSGEETYKRAMEEMERSRELQREGLRNHHASMTPEEKEDWALSIKEAKLVKQKEELDRLEPLEDSMRQDFSSGLLLPEVAEKYQTSVGYIRMFFKGKGVDNLTSLQPSKAGVPRSEEDRKAISKGRIGMKFSKEHRENISKAQMGRKISEKHKAVFNRRGAKNSPEHQAKINEANARRFQEKLDSVGFTFEKLKEMIKEGSTVQEVASRFQISDPTVTKIIKNNGYKSVKDLRKSLI